MPAVKPKILLLADKPGWAYDFSAQSIKKLLSDEFEFLIAYVHENPVEAARAFKPDIVHVFWWGEDWQHVLRLPKSRIIKEVSSFRWREEAKFGLLSPEAFVKRYLADAETFIATSLKMQQTIAPWCKALLTPNGIDPATFHIQGRREGRMKVGWAGNIDDACKGVKDIVMPACEGVYPLIIAPGNVTSRDDMRAFYNQVDVFCIASTAEGEPLTLIEASACGCFPVTVDVGIVPEVVVDGQNGLVVERSVAAFRKALDWCNDNLAALRGQAETRSAETHAVRDWKNLAPYWRAAYRQAVANAEKAGEVIVGAEPAPAAALTAPARLPRVLVCVDLPNWAHDFKTNNIVKNLSDRFEFRKRYHKDVTAADFEWCDVILIYYWKQLMELQPFVHYFPHKVTLGGISCPTDLEGGAYDIGMGALRTFDSVFVHNQLLHDEYKHRFWKGFFLNQNGVDTVFYTPGAIRPTGKPLIAGWAGSLTNHGPKRGYHNIILPAIAATPGVELHTAAREDKWRGPEEMRDFYRGLDVYLVASRVDGTPNPALEAAACGVPVIATPVGNMPELIRQGQNGFLIDHSPEALSVRLAQLRDDTPLLLEMRKRIREDILAWDWKLRAELYGRMIAESIARKGLNFAAA